MIWKSKRFNCFSERYRSVKDIKRDRPKSPWSGCKENVEINAAFSVDKKIKKISFLRFILLTEKFNSDIIHYTNTLMWISKR